MPPGKPEPDPPSTPPVGAIVAATLLALGGLLVGLVLGGDGDPRPQTIVQTVTVAQTETVRRTKTVVQTVTEPVDDLAEVTDEEDSSSTSTTDDADCSEDYLGACVPLDDPDADCASIDEREFDSIGADPYGLDPDGDGIACERR